MKSSLLSVLVLSVSLWPVGSYAQTGADSMGKAVKPDDMKWEALEGGFELVEVIVVGRTGGVERR